MIQNCKKANIRTVYWAFSARYCKPCFAAMWVFDLPDVNFVLRLRLTLPASSQDLFVPERTSERSARRAQGLIGIAFPQLALE